MSLNKELLDILVCPITKLPVRLVSSSNLKVLNRLILSGNLLNAEGERVALPLSEALITQNNTMIYPVIKSIPVMLEDQAIPVSQLDERLSFK